ncbi:MAG: lipopolysaccharide biosynthesis protein RfbH [Ignavibacteria bacterium]
MIIAGDIILQNPDEEQLKYVLVLNYRKNNGEMVVCFLNEMINEVPDDFTDIINPEDIEEAGFSTRFEISVKNMLTIQLSNHIRIAGLKKKKLDSVLRLLNHFTASLHFEAITKTKSSHSIPVSGKVLDEKDLFNMIDASLDMWLTTGRFNDRFETALANFLGSPYILTVNSGSSANLLAITALTSNKLGVRSLKPGDEIITVAAGFPTTINPIIQNNLIPVFLDVKPGTYNIDVDQIEESITERTKAIFIAHTLGNPFNLDRIQEIVKKYNLWLIEDNCDALGSKYKGKYTGAFGHLATLSFYPAHHITTGEGGAVIINDPELYNIVLSYRDWGRDCWCAPGKDNTCGKRFEKTFGNLPEGYDHKYVYSHIGYNLKMTDWQAAIGLSQLQKLPEFIEIRKRNFNLLYEGLKDFQDYLILPQAEEDSVPSWFGFLISIRDNTFFNKPNLIRHLDRNRTGTRNLFAGNILSQPAFLNNNISLKIRNSKLLKSSEITKENLSLLPNTNYIMTNSFWLGVTPLLSPDDIARVVEVVSNFIQEKISMSENTKFNKEQPK